jgi:hypothetical protein
MAVPAFSPMKILLGKTSESPKNLPYLPFRIAPCVSEDPITTSGR